MFTTAAATDRSIFFNAVEDVGGTNAGEPKTGLTFSNIESASYVRAGAARVSITPATLASASAAHSDGGFVEVDATNTPGLYRFDPPDAAFATGVDEVVIYVEVAGASNAIIRPRAVQITDFDLRTANVTLASATHTGAVIPTVSTLTGHTAQTGDSFARLGSPAGASVSADVADVPTVSEFDARTLVAASYFDPTADDVATVTTLTNKTGFSLAATGLDAIVSTATGMIAIAKAVWDRILTGATHNINNSSGKRLRAVADTIILSDTAQTGANTTITLNAGASTTDDFYANMRLITTGGTGAGQVKIIGPYNGTTKVATVLGGAWLVNPDATTEFEIVPALTHAVGTNQDLTFGYAISATSTTVVLNGVASAINDFYNDDLIIIHVGTGKGQSRSIRGYVGATKTVTIDRTWITTPDSTSEYVIIGSDRVWDHSTADHAVAGSFGKAVADTLVDTADMQPKLGSPAGTDMSADIADIPTVSEFEARTLTAADIAKLSASVGTIVSAVAETGTLSSTQMTSDLSEATNDHYIGRIILWTSGALTNQATDITDYAGASGLLTFTEVTDVPANNDTFIIV